MDIKKIPTPPQRPIPQKPNIQRPIPQKPILQNKQDSISIQNVPQKPQIQKNMMADDEKQDKITENVAPIKDKTSEIKEEKIEKTAVVAKVEDVDNNTLNQKEGTIENQIKNQNTIPKKQEEKIEKEKLTKDKAVQQNNIPKQEKFSKKKENKIQLSDQSKGILFGLLGGFSLVCAIVFFVLMFVL